ncbi:hypothetical protein MAR_019315 [Mya arenaria]|uniref:Uncharacterized protein n=1 Tax=Mya arenaria TaxID=6604 RepID=A0ABY7EK76_MYAAR|nr:hypothetical protein MAR_019315 [Mya arenaria]
MYAIIPPAQITPNVQIRQSRSFCKQAATTSPFLTPSLTNDRAKARDREFNASAEIATRSPSGLIKTEMSNQQRASQLLREAAALLHEQQAFTAPGQNTETVTAGTEYIRPTVHMHTSQLRDITPYREEKYRLFQADQAQFLDKLVETYPKLKDIGGLELLRTSLTSRNKLDIIPLPPGGGPKSFPTIMEEKLSELKGKKEEFTIRVVRRLFHATALDQLGEARQEDWSNTEKREWMLED